MSFLRHGQSYQSDEGQNRDRRFAPVPAIVSMSLRPAIPWRVGLHQSPPPLRRLLSMLGDVVVGVNHHLMGGGEFSTGYMGNFQPALTDSDIAAAQRVLVCTGKIGHELRTERQRRADTSTAIIMIEQLYPFPEQDLARELERHARAREVVWVQEEPANMGALSFVLPQLRRLSSLPPLRSVKRSASASPATGSAKANAIEQATLLALAFTRRE